MRKCFVFLFPEKDFFEGCSPKDTQLKYQFINQMGKIIFSRYIYNNFDIEMISLKGSKIHGFAGVPYGIIDVDKSYNDICHSRGVISFEELAHKFSKFGYDEVVVGGFFLNRAVDRFAKGLIEANRRTKVSVDLDMTELGWIFSRDKNGNKSNHFHFDTMSNQNSCQTLIENLELSKSQFENMMLYNKLPSLYKAPYDVNPNKLKFVNLNQDIDNAK